MKSTWTERDQTIWKWLGSFLRFVEHKDGWLVCKDLNTGATVRIKDRGC